MPAPSAFTLAQKKRLRSKIRNLIGTKFKNQAALAFELKIKPASVNTWISGKSSPSVPMAQKLAKLAGEPYEEFIGEPGDENEGASVAYPLRVVADERYSQMGAVLAMADALQYPKAFVDSWRAQLKFDGQPDAEQLFFLMKAAKMQWDNDQGPGLLPKIRKVTRKPSK